MTNNEEFLNEAGNISRFIYRFFTTRLFPGFEFKEFLIQCFFIGYKSLPLVGLTGFIMGLVLTMQLRPSLMTYGVEAQLPLMVGIAIIRERGPVITALIFAGKIGSSMGAELGSMKVTELDFSDGTTAAFAALLELKIDAGVFYEAEINEKHIDDRLSQLAKYEINIKAKSPIALPK